MTNTDTDSKGDSRTMDRHALVAGDANLYHRGVATLLAAWEQYAHASEGAAVHRLAGVAAAVFPTEPERSVYNNTVLKRGLAASRRAEGIAAMEAAYANAGVTRYAAGYTRPAGRCAQISNGGLFARRGNEHLRIAEVHPGLLSGLGAAAFHVLGGRHRGENVVTGIAFDFTPTAGYTTWGRWNGPADAGLGTALTLHTPARRARARMSNGPPPVDGDGRAALRGRGVPRPWSDPRVRPIPAVRRGLPAIAGLRCRCASVQAAAKQQVAGAGRVVLQFAHFLEAVAAVEVRCLETVGH